MEVSRAAIALSALGNERRLTIFRMLVEAGPDGIAAGEIARRLDMLQNTLSSSLAVMAHAGVVRSRREGRSIIYSADYRHINDLLGFLVHDCCGGDPSRCGEPFFAVLAPTRPAVEA